MTEVGILVSTTGFPASSLQANSQRQSMTSLQNQFKIKLKGALHFTGAGQQKNIVHRSNKTPAFLAFIKEASTSYYHEISPSSYVNNEVLHLVSLNNGDRINYIVLEDYGAGV